MIKKLKIKFVAVIMGILTFVFLCIVGGIITSSYVSNERQTNELLQMVASADGGWSPEKKQPPKEEPWEKPEEGRREDLFALSSYYAVKLDSENNITEIINERKSVFQETQIIEAVNGVIESGKSSGRAGSEKFLVEEKDYGKIIVFVDNRVAEDNIRRMAAVSSIIGLAGLTVLFFVSLLLAGWVIKPVESSFEKQKQFVSDASHELKTPVAVISANADVLEGEIGENKWLSYIKSESERMNALVTQLLTLARAEEQGGAEFQSFNLSRSVLSVALPFESTAFEQNKDYDVQVAENITCFGNEEMIKQLAVILIDNAFKHTREGAKIKVSLSIHGGKRTIEVFNTGEGLDAAEIEQIFERFYRSDKSRQRVNGNYGLGLSIAKAIVEQHKGKLNVESKKGEGITFTAVI